MWWNEKQPCGKSKANPSLAMQYVSPMSRPLLMLIEDTRQQPGLKRVRHALWQPLSGRTGLKTPREDTPLLAKLAALAIARQLASVRATMLT
jgi:hypothetical protein